MSDGYGAPCAPINMETPEVPTTRDLLECATRWVEAHEHQGYRPAKARVHDMTLAELVAIPTVRAMLHQAAVSNVQS